LNSLVKEYAEAEDKSKFMLDNNNKLKELGEALDLNENSIQDLIRTNADLIISNSALEK
jgi:putative NIF3 family GTP cyclohydrolase 1 type 2